MQPKTNKLGRGLSALLTPSENATLDQSFGIAETASHSDGISYVPLKKIQPGKWQPRQHFNDQDIESLAESIQKNGVLQPILVTYDAPEDRYLIIAGERRWRAALRAQLVQIPVLVRKDIQEVEALTIALVENIQRADLSAIEEALGYHRLMESMQCTQEKISDLVGKSRSHIANSLRLLQLPKSIQAILQNLEISPGHARCLIGLSEHEALAIIDEIIHKKLNVRQVERLIKQRKAKEGGVSSSFEVAPTPKSLPTANDDPEVAGLERMIQQRLQMTASLQMQGAGGTLTLGFASMDILDGFLNAISKSPTSETKN